MRVVRALQVRGGIPIRTRPALRCRVRIGPLRGSALDPHSFPRVRVRKVALTSITRTIRTIRTTLLKGFG